MSLDRLCVDETTPFDDAAPRVERGRSRSSVENRQYPSWAIRDPRQSRLPEDGFYREHSNLLFSLSVNPATLQRSEVTVHKPDQMNWITKHLPQHRPPTRLTDGFQIEKVIAEVGEDGPVYVKGDAEAAHQVWRVEPQLDQRWAVTHAFSEHTNLSAMDLWRVLFANGGAGYNKKIVEAEIPIARTPEGRTWEMRFCPTERGPASARDFSCMKVALDGSHVNNIRRGGEWKEGVECRELLERIISHACPVKDLQARVKAEEFLTQSEELASTVKLCMDGAFLTMARSIVDPSSFREPGQYGFLMRDCFASTAFCSDITGRWDIHRQALVPMIVECQAGVALPLRIASPLGTEIVQKLAAKYELFMASLKDPSLTA